MKRKKKIIMTVLLLVVVAFCFIFYQTFHAAHRNIGSEKATFSMLATQLQSEFVRDYADANTTYADKAIEVKGRITLIERNTIMLDDVIQVDFLEVTRIVLGTTIVVKGRCVGTDDLLEVVKLDQAIELTKNQNE